MVRGYAPGVAPESLGSSTAGSLLGSIAVTAATQPSLEDVIGGAIALHILFGIPLLAGGVISGVVSMLLLAVQMLGTMTPLLLFPAKLYCGQSLLDSRRESVISMVEAMA